MTTLLPVAERAPAPDSTTTSDAPSADDQTTFATTLDEAVASTSAPAPAPAPEGEAPEGDAPDAPDVSDASAVPVALLAPVPLLLIRRSNCSVSS